MLSEALKLLSEWEIVMIEERLKGLVSAFTRVAVSSWSKPPHGIWNCNIDTVAFHTSGCSRVGAIVHYSSGKFVVAVSLIL